MPQNSLQTTATVNRQSNVPIVEKVASKNKIKFEAIHLETKEQAQVAPFPCTSYAPFLTEIF